MNDQQLNQLMTDQVKILTTDKIINFLDLQLLGEVAKQQLMLPTWRRADPERTRQLEAVLYRLQAVEEERRERCVRFSKALGEHIRAEGSGLLPADHPWLTIAESGKE